MHKKLLLCLTALMLIIQPMLFAAAETNNDAQMQTQKYTSNKYTQVDGKDEPITSANSSLAGFEQAAESEKLVLFVNPKSLAIKVQNKATGYIWSSTIDSMDNFKLNQSWKDFVESAITIEYLNRQGKLAKESITTNDSTVKIERKDNGFTASISFMQAKIKMKLSVELTDNDVVISLPEESIEESTNTKLVSVQTYPFFGATAQDTVPGYMFIPDGAGALIRYDHDVAMASPYIATVYGNDAGIAAPTYSVNLNAEYTASMPIYGVVHGIEQNAFLGVIEAGDLYSQIMAYKAGLSTEFNWITTKFIYRYAYKQPTSKSDKSGTAIETYQSEANKFDIQLRLKVLDNEAADYVGLAQSYQQYLIDQGILKENEGEGDNPILRLEFLGAEMKKGLLWNTVVPMTPFDSLPGLVEQLNEEGVEDLFLVYKGWYKNGLNGSLLNKFPFEKKLGKKSEIKDTIKELEEQQVPVYFHTDYLKALKGSTGFFSSVEYSKQINSKTILDMTGDLNYYYVTPTDALELAKEHMKEYEDYGMNRLAADSISSNVFSVFNKDTKASREQNRALSLETMDVLGDGNADRLALYEPNAYAWGKTDKYLDTPLSSSGYLYVSDTVPFLQIVLKGYVDMYSPYMNFSSNIEDELLKLIDYGTYPSFYLTEKSSFLLSKTASRNVYTSEFSSWKDEIVHQYGVIQDTLAQVKDATIIDREVLSPGVVAITYSNQTTFIVNYTDHSFAREDVTVEAKDFAVLKGDKYRDPGNN